MKDLEQRKNLIDGEYTGNLLVRANSVMLKNMVVAIADGPLLVGDILLAASTASAAVIIAANWALVRPDWNSIINAFTTAFSTAVSNVRDAFAEIEVEIPNIQSAPPISVDGNEVTVGKERYLCSEDAEYLSKENCRKGVYYLAVIFAGSVWIDLDHPMDKGKAHLIIAADHGRVGIFASSASDARSLAGPRYVGPEGCNHASGFFMHYHNPVVRHAHIWYLYG